MYLIDTNVISEFRKIKTGKADQNVASWASGVRASTLFLSAITFLELEHATLLLERHDARQGSVLRAWLEGQVTNTFADRTFPITTAIARVCARLRVPDPRPVRDALIAATALVHSMPVVTRDVADFKPMGVPVINPWEPQ